MPICCMAESGLVIWLGHAQCSVITEDGEQGFFPRPGPYFSVYGVILYKCCLQIVGIEA